MFVLYFSLFLVTEILALLFVLYFFAIFSNGDIGISAMLDFKQEVSHYDLILQLISFIHFDNSQKQGTINASYKISGRYTSTMTFWRKK